jgi:diketogulonate reductase-like aldo/keto reductase
VVEAYSPLVQGVRANEPVLTALTKKYNKSFAQVLVRWSLQKVTFFFGSFLVLREFANSNNRT